MTISNVFHNVKITSDCDSVYVASKIFKHQRKWTRGIRIGHNSQFRHVNHSQISDESLLSSPFYLENFNSDVAIIYEDMGLATSTKVGGA